MRVANNYNEFVEKVTEASRQALNKTELGQEITEKLLRVSLERNPEMTAEEWQETKSKFLTLVFFETVNAKPELMKELGGHVYNELNAE